MKKENKEEICNQLYEALVLTRQCEDLLDLTYYWRKEEVIALFKNGYSKTINVEADSGFAMIKDIMRALS